MTFLSRIAGLFSSRSTAPIQLPEKQIGQMDRAEHASGNFPDLSPTDRDVLIRTVYGEARGEGAAGQAAVVHCIRNRLARPKRFRPTVAGICQQPWQFSCWNAADPNLARMNALRPGSADYERIGDVVDRAWQAPDSIGGADHYYATYIVRPRWTDPPAYETARIGVHVFYAGVA